ncbi:MAG: hypothetical protein ACRC37_00435, partial [Lentisphaeria bacterium]
TLSTIAFITLAVSFFVYSTVSSFKEIILENKQLREAVNHLTSEDPIAYVKVIHQEIVDGKIKSTLKFVEVAPHDSTKIIQEHQLVINGDVAHFDALIIKFSNQFVTSGQEKALYIWRRIYDANTAPENGYLLNLVGKQPPAYEQVFGKLKPADRHTFWQGIWSLADSPDKLKSLGIQVIYGSTVYYRLKPGFIYVLKLSSQGQIIPQPVLQI